MPTISTLTVDVNARTSRFSAGMRTALVGLTALAAGAGYAFKKFEESENVLQQTEAVLKSTGAQSWITSRQIADMADELSHLSGVDDEVIQSGQNMLLTFKNIQNEAGKNNDIFNQATVAALDMAAGYAAASGSQINLKAATIQLGKALNDPIAGMSALTRVGVQFTEQQQEQITALVESGNLLGAQKIILAEVTSQFEGSAEAQATASGKMKVALENLAEAVGGVLAPAIEKLVGWITQAAEWFANLDPGMQSVITTAAGMAAVLGVLAKAFGFLLLPAIKAVIASLSVLVAHPIIAMLVGFAAVVALVATKWDDLHGAIKVVLAIFMPVATGLGLLIRNFDTLRDAVVAFGQKVVSMFKAVKEAVETVANLVAGAFVAAWRGISGPVLAVINGIINAIRTLVGWIGSAISKLGELGSAVPKIGLPGLPFDIPGIPFLHDGGTISKTGLAVVHAGETVVPPGGFPNSGGGDVILQIDGQTFARIARDELLKLKGSRVSLGLA